MGPKNSKTNKKSKKKKINKEKKTNNNIEDQIKYSSENNYRSVRLLVLGCGESGKTTFIKQLKILHQNGFLDRDRELYHDTIRLNCILHTKVLLNSCATFGWDLKDENKEIAKDFILNVIDEENSLTPSVGQQIKKLWADSALKTAYENRHNFQLPDSANYFLDKIEKISVEDYEPDDQDILMCRIPTTGVNEIQFNFGDTPWSVIDVGGQRSERRKWIHQFEDVTLIIYVVATSEYNQKLYEDIEVNRMHESLLLFRKTANNEYFKEKNCVIFFNKMDLFEEKILKYDMNCCFKKYNGGLNIEEGKKFLKKKFVKEGKNESRNIFVHWTCATDTKNIEKVFDAVNVSILENTLKNGGYM
ncbi:guanine nucleotide-binding protein g(o) subunit alpha [Anaeramoeba flamelloides]|uniref:Guanine nucleotide-binding protein g(O) subunit alpha n=1 Tax=Anaeramoeba flamelloides TaxID=1746091 RepID=A0AAV7YYJ1_9EUKA|nr:guanine nucleotide-binding protein g(o) subunit alpha [Anaeramoeba flamelloides]